jgi:UDP-N-acetylmuramoyl-tripeptide--D-alanyl-D-alanine ligase
MTIACATLAVVSDAHGTPVPVGDRRGAQHDGVPGRKPESTDGLTADDLVAATGGQFLARGRGLVLGAAVDSRLVEPGNLFVALPGERTDGHRFVADAVAAGAAAVLVSRPLEPSELARLGDATVLLVDDGVRALGAIARAWRSRFELLVVGVTGSIAKTSTKEAIAAVLGRRFRTLRNEGNRNNEIGLPLTLLALRPKHEAAVLEMGMYVGGEIRDLAAMGRPRIGVVTAVQPVHLSRIGSLDAIEQAKGELVEALPAADAGGVAVLNVDDARVARMAGRTGARVVSYGFAPEAEVTAAEVESRGFEGMQFVLRLPAGRDVHVSTAGLGRMAVHNALAAAAVADAVGLDPDVIAQGLAGGWAAPHRAALVRAGSVTIVDDSYNASPASVRAALELLGGLPGRRIAVLGEMLELGDLSDEGHRSVGEAAAAMVDLLVVVGEGAAGIADGARSAGMARHAVVVVPDRARAVDTLLPQLRPADIVLVKASRGAELDRVVDELATALGPDRESAVRAEPAGSLD